MMLPLVLPRCREDMKPGVIFSPNAVSLFSMLFENEDESKMEIHDPNSGLAVLDEFMFCKFSGVIHTLFATGFLSSYNC